MIKIQLAKEVANHLTFQMLDELCTKFGCTLDGATATGDWIIEAEEGRNIFWLGVIFGYMMDSDNKFARAATAMFSDGGAKKGCGFYASSLFMLSGRIANTS